MTLSSNLYCCYFYWFACTKNRLCTGTRRCRWNNRTHPHNRTLDWRSHRSDSYPSHRPSKSNLGGCSLSGNSTARKQSTRPSNSRSLPANTSSHRHCPAYFGRLHLGVLGISASPSVDSHIRGTLQILSSLRGSKPNTVASPTVSPSLNPAR